MRALTRAMAQLYQTAIATGNTSDDPATKIMTTPDPVSGACFGAEEMSDQGAVFFLACHETSASVLAWCLYLLALYPEWQDAIITEMEGLNLTDFAALAALKTMRDVVRETLRLYPPVPMMLRQTTQREPFRKRAIKRGAQIVFNPWHLHRHTRLWENPVGFDPGRGQTETGRASARRAYLPSPGAGFAMMEGVMILAQVVRLVRVELADGTMPVPVAHLIVRSRDGLCLRVVRR